MKRLFTLIFVLFSWQSQAQDNIINYDQARSDSVFVDVGGGVKESSFSVTGNLQTLVFMLIFQDGNPVIEFVAPRGEVLGLDSPRLSVQRTEWGVLAGLKEPSLGTWILRLSQTLGEGSYFVRALSVPAIPTVQVYTPSFLKEPWTVPFSVEGQTQPDQAGKRVLIYLSSTEEENGGIIAGETTVRADGRISLGLDPSEFPQAEYSVVLSIEDDENPSVKARAPGTLDRKAPAPPRPIPDVKAFVEQPSTLIVMFDNPFGRTPTTFRVHVLDVAGGEIVRDIGTQTKAQLKGFSPGPAEVWVTAVDAQGQEGAPSSRTSLVFGVTPPVPPTLSLTQPTIETILEPNKPPVNVRFGLTGTYRSQGSSVDYVEPVVGNLPAGMGLRPLRDSWFLPNDSAHLDFELYVTSEIIPGMYQIPITFRTVGSPQNAVPGVLRVQAIRPPPRIDSVQPSTWAESQSPVLEVLGEYFAAGTKVFIDGIEHPLVKLSERTLKVRVPPTLATGDHILSIQGADSSSATSILTVKEPGYNILAFKTVSKTLAGTTARFWLGLKAVNGFAGEATLLVASPGPDWAVQANPSVVSDGMTSVITVAPPASALPGEYHATVITSEGGQIDLTVTVVDSPPAPFLSSLSSYAELAGGTFSLRGYGFGASGQITVDDQRWIASSWSDDEITVTVPTGAKTGLLRVERLDGQISNGITFGVKDYGFQYHTNQSVFALQGGDERTFEVQLSGYKQEVSLTVQSLSPMVQAFLDSPNVTPVGLTRLRLKVDKNIPVGSYTVNLNGTSGLYTAGLALTVQIGTALEFTTLSLATAMFGTNYSVLLGAEGGIGPLQFELAEGVFPAGIKLDPSGLISGRPSQTGQFRVVLAVTDQDGHKTPKEFLLNVEETGWFMPNRDEGGSAYSPVDAPADARALWSSAPLGSPRMMLAGSGNLYFESDAGLTGLYGPKGTVMYRIPGAIASWRYAPGRLVVLGSDGVLHSYESNFGNEVWRREGVDQFWVRSGTLLAEVAGTILRLDTNDGTLFDSRVGDMQGHLFGWQGDLYRLKGRSLERWADTSGWETLKESSDQAWVAAYADGGALYLTDAAQRVFQWNGDHLTLLWTGPVHRLIISNDWLVVDTGSSITVRDRDGSLLRQFPGGDYDSLLASREKLFAVVGGNVKSINLSSGATIWQTQGARALLLGDRLYVAAADGTVTAHNAPDNLKAPETALVTLPPLPNGTNNWFTVAPQVMLNATDAETFAETTNWKVGAAEWAPYAPLTVGDGIHSLAWHSVDNHGKQEADKLAVLRVDTTSPTSTLTWTPGPLASLPQVFGAKVTLTLTASDTLSGLARIEYRWDEGEWQTYSSPFVLEAQKAYALSYRSVDQAGNAEASRTFRFHVDYQDPQASVEVDSQDQATVVFLAGTDPGTGVARLEYKVGDGPITLYQDAIPFLTTGRWTVSYRAVDLAGRSSAWKTVDVRNQGPAADERVSKIEYHKDVRGRDNEFPIAVGDEIFTNSKEKFLSLPAEVIGGLYLRHRDTDAQLTASTYTTLTFRGSAQVYYLQESDSKVVLNGWTKGAFLPAGTVSKTYFKGGLQVWTKAYQAGEKAIFAGPGLKHTGGDLVFVQAPWVGVSILKPAPESTLSPGQSVTLQALTGPVNAEVTWTLGEGRRAVALGKGNSLTVTLPADLEGRSVDLKASISDGSRTYQDEGRFDLRLPEKLAILYPSPRFPVKQGVPLKPVTLWRDSQGRPGKVPVTWTLKKGDQVLYQGAAPVPVNASGPLTLIGTAVGATGQTITATTTFQTVAEWPWVKWRWRDKGHKEWRDDDGEGFWSEHHAEDDHREAQFGNRKTTLDVWKWTKDADYRVSLADGTYEVSLVVGPFRAWEVHSIIVNERALNVTSKKNGEVMRLKFVVQVTEGTLSIKGTQGLPIYRLDYRRVGDNTPLTATLDKTLDSPEDLE